MPVVITDRQNLLNLFRKSPINSKIEEHLRKGAVDVFVDHCSDKSGSLHYGVLGVFSV
jgi:hypothetical protein